MFDLLFILVFRFFNVDFRLFSFKEFSEVEKEISVKSVCIVIFFYIFNRLKIYVF